MSRPEELRSATENTLHDLIADDALKFRILQKAAQQKTAGKTYGFPAIPVFCSVLAVLLITVVALNSLQAVPDAGPGDLISFTAGNSDSLAVSVFPEGCSPDDVVSVSMDQDVAITDSESCARLAQVLLEKATVAEKFVPSGNTGVTFVFEDGQTLTFSAEDPCLAGNDGRCWNCPEFFSEFSQLTE